MDALDELKKTQKEIADLKKAVAAKEALLPGLLLMAALNGGKNYGAVVGDDSSDMRLRISDTPLKTLEILEEKGGDVSYQVILKAFNNDAREARYSIRNLAKRKLASRNEENDTARITPLGSDFIRKYREKKDNL